jgi:hypothetical protein
MVLIQVRIGGNCWNSLKLQAKVQDLRPADTNGRALVRLLYVGRVQAFSHNRQNNGMKLIRLASQRNCEFRQYRDYRGPEQTLTFRSIPKAWQNLQNGPNKGNNMSFHPFRDDDDARQYLQLAFKFIHIVNQLHS